MASAEIDQPNMHCFPASPSYLFYRKIGRAFLPHTLATLTDEATEQQINASKLQHSTLYPSPRDLAFVTLRTKHQTLASRGRRHTFFLQGPRVPALQTANSSSTSKSVRRSRQTLGQALDKALYFPVHAV
ncbi:unnamed protein product [Somion occarium]|uniref:Uncharacterized protein n=1 Tax=Somion occarium TaxID=3059160 RepID=A0ABP1DL29_9APHY